MPEQEIAPNPQEKFQEAIESLGPELSRVVRQTLTLKSAAGTAAPLIKTALLPKLSAPELKLTKPQALALTKPDYDPDFWARVPAKISQ